MKIFLIQKLAEELHKPVINKINKINKRKKIKKRKVHLPFIDNIEGADLADIQLISKFNKGFRFLLCVIDIYSRYAWVIPLKDKKGITITDAFQKILQESNKKPNKICFDKGSEFYNRSTKSWLERTKENEGESVIAERFIKINKYMTSVSQNVYIDKLGDIVNKYNNTYHSKIKIKPVDVKSNAYIDTSKEINDKNPKFINGDLLKYQNIKTFLQKAALQKGLKKFL